MTYPIPLVNLLLALGGIIIFATGCFIFAREKNSILHRALKTAQKGDLIKARELIRDRLARDNNDPFPHYYMSLVDSIEGKTDQVLKHLLEIKRIGLFEQEINPSDIFLKIGTIYYHKNEFIKAFSYFQEAVEIDSSREAPLAYLAFLSVGQEEFSLAEKYFQLLVQVAPEASEYHIARGVTQAMLNDRQQAVISLQKGLSLDTKNETAAFLTSLVHFKMEQGNKAYQTIRHYVEDQITMDPYINYIVHRLATACCYLNQDYQKALQYAEICLAVVVVQEWHEQERDSRISIFYQALFAGNCQKAEDILLSLEIRDSKDPLVLRFANFRRDLREGTVTVERICQKGLDLKKYMEQWLKTRFADHAVYKLSGLEQEIKFDIPTSRDEQKFKTERKEEEGKSFIKKFNSLETLSFLDVCERMISELGFQLYKRLNYAELDGANFLAKKKNNPKISALFQIRKWGEQPISDIFLRDQQNDMKEQQADLGFVIAASQLTIGAEQELNRAHHITVINEGNLIKLLSKTL